MGLWDWVKDTASNLPGVKAIEYEIDGAKWVAGKLGLYDDHSNKPPPNTNKDNGTANNNGGNGAKNPSNTTPPKKADGVTPNKGANKNNDSSPDFSEDPLGWMQNNWQILAGIGGGILALFLLIAFMRHR